MSDLGSHISGYERFSASSAHFLLHAGFSFRLLFRPEDGGNTFLQNVSCLSPDYKEAYRAQGGIVGSGTMLQAGRLQV
jgi:hypothetical protein